MEAGLQVTFDAATTVRFLKKIAETLPETILNQLGIVSARVGAVMREKAPAGVTKELKQSVGFEIDAEAGVSIVKPSKPYADFVETGTRPHVPPIAPLIPWAEMHGINPWALQRSIARKGTLPHPYIVPTYIETAPEVGALFADGLKTMFEEAKL